MPGNLRPIGASNAVQHTDVFRTLGSATYSRAGSEVFRTYRDHTPFHQRKLSDRFLRMLPDDWDWLGWSDYRRRTGSPVITSPHTRIFPERPRTLECSRRSHGSCSTIQIIV